MAYYGGKSGSGDQQSLHPVADRLHSCPQPAQHPVHPEKPPTPSSSPARKRVFVRALEMDPIRLVGLKSVFDNHSEVNLVTDSAVDILDDTQVQIAILGAHGGNRVLALLASLRAHRPEVKAIVMSPVAGDDAILKVLSMGAKGYLHESASEFELGQAIRVVAHGSIWASRRILSLFIEELLAARDAYMQRGGGAFTQREREVLDLLLAGLSNREIARKLKIEERTVKAYVTKLMAKTGVRNRTALSMHALAHADNDPDPGVT